MNAIIAKSYARLIKAGRKTIDQVPADLVELVKAQFPEGYFDGGEK